MAAARRAATGAARRDVTRPLIGLLAVTGCRPGKRSDSTAHDVDLDDGVVHVRAGKNNKQRRGAAAPEHHQRASRLRRPA